MRSLDHLRGVAQGSSWGVDHLRRSAQHALGKRQTDLSRHRAVQDDLEDGVFFDREIAWVRSFEDPVDLSGDDPPTSFDTRLHADQRAPSRTVSAQEQLWEAALDREGKDPVETSGPKRDRDPDE